MNAACPACGTENGPFAKFCINCIGVLSTTFTATELMPQFGAARKAVRQSETMPQPSAVAAPKPARQAGPLAEDKEQVAPKKGLWVSVPAFAIACVVGAAGWLFAGAGGTDLLGFGSPNRAIAPAQVQPVAPAVAPPIAPVSPAESPARVVPPSAPAPKSSPETSTPVAGKSAPATPPRVSQNAPHASDTLPTAPRLSAASPRPKPLATPQRDAGQSSPETQCSAMGFFARSRCMAQQCASAVNRSHPSCQDVLQQQRLMEEKRNPTMSN